MIHTSICDLLKIKHPIVLGGMRFATPAKLVAPKAGDANNTPLLFGQDAGLIDSVKPAAAIIEAMIAEAHEIIGRRLRSFAR